MKDTLPPHSIEAERAVLGSILLDPSTLETCQRVFGHRAVFYDLRHRTIYEAAQELRSKKKPVEIGSLTNALKHAENIKEIGGVAYLSELISATPAATSVEYYASLLTEKAELRELIRECTDIASKAQDANGDASEFISIAKARLSLMTQTNRGKLDGHHDWDRLSQMDINNDPNCLIGRRYLCRGHGAWMIGPSGIGKSSLLLQIAVVCCLGQRLYGIPCHRPLRVLVVQAENDDGDLAEMVQGLVQGMALDGFGEDSETLSRNLHIRTTTGRTGAAWCLWLRQEIESTGAELVLVDPLLSFAGIDVSRQDQCSTFLRVHLDPVLRETGAAMIAAHHTGKPPRKDGKAAAPTIYEQAYAGLGSSELVNWARACIVLEPAGDGIFRLTLSKRGQRAGATHPNGEPTRVVWLRHAQTGIYWEQLEPPEEQPEERQEQAKGGRPNKAQTLVCSNLHEVLSKIPSEGISGRKLGDELHSFSRKIGEQVSASTCREKVIDMLVKSQKIAFDDATQTYKRGANA